ncbi:MAG: response regulator [Cytophagaceae bacterium]
MINVFIAEDHKIVREGIISMFRDEKDISIVGEAENGKEVLEKMGNLNVDVMLVDINMPHMNGTELTRHISENYKDIKILALSMMDHENYVTQMFEAGATGYLLKNTGREELKYALRRVSEGEPYISHKIAVSMIKKLADQNRMSSTCSSAAKISVDLSDRELEILELIAEGFTNTEIADKTFTSRRTVETHRKNLIEKTGAKNTATLIKFAIVNGILK